MLKYVGGGFAHGVPARDLTDEEASAFNREWLLATKLYVYEPDETKDEKPAPAANKLGTGPRENKSEV